MSFVKLSPTKSSTWVDCPRRYFFTYIARERIGRRWAHFSLGNAIHRALRDWFDASPQSRSALSVETLVSSAWSSDGFRDAEQSETWRKRAVEMVKTYVSDEWSNLEPLGNERTLAFKQGSLIMEGRIDRLDEASEGVTVIDYKTGKKPPLIDEVRGSPALAMYALMVQRALGRQCRDVSLHHIPSGEIVSWTHSDDSLTRHLDRMLSIASDIGRAQDTWEASDQSREVGDELFPARPSALCGYCDFWELCPTGQAFVSQKESWEGLVD